MKIYHANLANGLYTDVVAPNILAATVQIIKEIEPDVEITEIWKVRNVDEQFYLHRLKDCIKAQIPEIIAGLQENGYSNIKTLNLVAVNSDYIESCNSIDIWNNSISARFLVNANTEKAFGLGLRFMEMGHFGEGSSIYGKIKYF